MYKFNRGLASMYSAYIKNNRKAEGSTGSVIPLLLSPNSLSETLSANYDQQNIPGHRAPIISYSYTGARQVSLSYTVAADHVPAGYTMNSYIQALKDLEYPTYDASVVYAPSCTLVLPNLSIDGVCTSVTIDYKVERTLRNGTMSAEVSLSFTEVKDTLNGYVNINLNPSGNDATQTSNTNNGDKKTPDIELEDKLSIYGEGLSQSSPLEIKYSASGSWTNYDERTQEVIDEVIVKYTVYGDVSNVKIDCTCTPCGQVFPDCSELGVLGTMGDHLNAAHKGKSTNYKLTYHGKTSSGSKITANDRRYIKAISKK